MRTRPPTRLSSRRIHDAVARLRLIRFLKRGPEDPQAHLGRSFLIALVAMGALAAFITYLNWDNVETILLDVSLIYLVPATGLALASTTFTSFSFATYAALFGVRMRLRDLAEVGFLSIAFGRFVAFTGVPGYSMRIMLAKRWGAAPEDVLAASLIHSMSNDLMLFALVPVGLAYIIVVKQILGWQLISLLVAISLFVVMILAWLTFAFYPRFRRAVLRFAARVWRALTGRDVQERMDNLDETLRTGTNYLRRRPKLLELPFTLVAIDWALALATLWMCFFTFGARLNPGELITGFAFGMFAGYISNLPGGLGVLEGSMAGTFAYLGVTSFEVAALAALMYRVTYYVIPFVVSLAFYWRHLRSEERRPGGSAGAAKAP